MILQGSCQTKRFIGCLAQTLGRVIAQQAHRGPFQGQFASQQFADKWRTSQRLDVRERLGVGADTRRGGIDLGNFQRSDFRQHARGREC